jgi:2-dehydro-3-deoxygluconokinase
MTVDSEYRNSRATADMTTAARRRRIAALGECMIELRQDPGGNLSCGFAGDTLNTATYLRRLLPVATFDVTYITAVGDDHLSDQMLGAWQNEGIDTTLVRRLPGELPGLYWIRTDDRGEREFFYWRSQSAARRLLSSGYAPNIRNALRADDVLYVSGISFAILEPEDRELLMGLVAELRQRGVRIVYDSNYRPRLWRGSDAARAFQEQLLPVIDIFISSHGDEAAMFGDKDIGVTAERLAVSGVPEWVVRGEPGQTIASGAGRAAERFLEPGQIVDTTGAGDSFDAAYLAARLSGRTVSQAISAGHGLAADVVRHRGAIIPRAAMPAPQT